MPFELGRPLGPPGDAAFQTRVVVAALELLEAEAGPVLVDFPEEAPAADDEAGWACPVNLAAPGADDGAEEGLESVIERELAWLAPWYDLASQRRGRTTVGASGLAIAEVARFATSFLDDRPAENPPSDLTLAEALRLAGDDLKAYYVEAATAQPGDPSSTQLGDWFWNQTAAGKLLLVLRDICLKSEDEGMRATGNRLVPRARVPGAD